MKKVVLFLALVSMVLVVACSPQEPAQDVESVEMDDVQLDEELGSLDELEEFEDEDFGLDEFDDASFE